MVWGSAKIVGGVDVDVQSQVEECQALIARTGWTLGADPYAYTEKHKSGYYRVERPVLDAVLQLAQRGEVDVIVAREMERVSRTKAGRYQAIGTAAKYGAEFRFANLPPNGKHPNTTEGKLYLAMLEEFGEMERDRIVERTAPGRERRLAAGIPSGGRFGPTYGYRWPDKNGAKTNDAFVEVPEESAIIRELYARISDGDASAHKLARELGARGVPTPSGRGEWSASQIIRLIRNPIYCGRGRTKRWETVRTTIVNSETREVYDYATSRDRTRRDTYVEETYPIDANRAPALVTPEVWDRAQAAMNEKKNFYGKLGRWNSPHPVEATLLHGGYVRCARCGSPMVRQWAKVVNGPRYRCVQRGNNPNHPCVMHNISATIVDDMTLRTIAQTLANPEQIIALADAADERAVDAADAVEMVDTKLAVQRELEVEIERARADHLAAIAALGALAGHEDMVAKLRAELVQLDRDAEQAQAAHERALPEHECALRRQRMLDRISHFRNRQTILDLSRFDQDGTATLTNIPGSGERVLERMLDLTAAADLLGMSEDEVRALGLHTVADDEEGWVEQIETEEVLYRLFKNAPYERLRQMIDDLGVRVTVAPPWAKEARAIRGYTPAEARVRVRLLSDPEESASIAKPSAIVWTLMTHCDSVTPPPNSRRNVGKATFTTVASRMTMKMPKMTENRMPHLFGGRCRMRTLPMARSRLERAI